MSEKIFDIFETIPEIEPDATDLKMLSEIESKGDETSFTEFKNSILAEREAKFSGKLNIRIPKSLHCDLSKEAKQQGVSLNQYIAYVLASRNR